MTTNDEPQTETSSGPLSTLLKSFSIIEYLYDVDGATAKDIAAAFDLPMSTAYLYLNTLVSAGYVVKDGSTFSLGLQFLQLGSGIRNRMGVYTAAKGHLRGVAEKSEELVELQVEENGKGVIVMREESERAIDDNTFVGQRENLHTSAVGKAILAHLSEERVLEIVEEHGLVPQTTQTITDEEELFEELEKIRERGVAYSEEESVLGVRGVGAPIISDEGDVKGAVSISGPTNRITDERLQNDLQRLVLEVTNIIELEIRHYH
ncbi:IclR family transcription regulator (plasmid) [Haloferax gibbonsii]|uniref:IclR family transcription regulator n=1 Tax=Haloferax gibbonsii TaxID=35746 RepID=A0A871BM53_HALGI|nr:IclR family transcriptional regulator [Haloferax gibbonsii]QOS14088.1 IclR family transcription regulator [Haloferax gibbonsii]